MFVGSILVPHQQRITLPARAASLRMPLRRENPTMAILYLGGVATAGAYAIYTLGLRLVPASVAGIVTLTEPFTATLLGVLLFGERLGVTGVLGALLLCAALGLVLGPPDAFSGRLAR